MPGISEDDILDDPVKQFRAWYDEAGIEAVALVTATADADPSGRMVLLRGADERGFVFYTNRTSAKAADLAANPRAGLVFYWPPNRQVRVAGAVSWVSEEESDAYWRNRPRGSQLSAWASDQSEVVAGRAELEARVAELEERFPDEVPRPADWGGYRITPETIEFWHHREDRLHDRLRFRRPPAGETATTASGWVRERLAP